MATSSPRPARTGRPTSTRLALGGLAGLLAGAAAVGASEAVAALLAGVTSPLLAVGNRVVDATPRPLKEFAIETFGENDKPVLIGSVVVTVALLAVLAGVLGVRRPRVAVGAFLALSVVAAVAALGDRSATAGPLPRLLPALALVAVGPPAVHWLLRRLSRAGTLPGHVAGDDLPAGFDRRGFLQAALAVGAVAAAGGAVRQLFGGSAAAAQRADVALPRPGSPVGPLPSGASLDVPGITPHLTPNAQFYRVDTALRVPDVPVEGYTLRIHGMVDQELELTFEDLLARRMVERRITLTCVSNPVGGEYVGNATWLGIPVRDLLAEAGVRDGADAVKSTSADDMTIGTPLQPLTDPGRDALLAVGMNGEPLPLAHGFPVRMVVPGLYGYVSATKWLVDLEVTRFADFKAYWSTRGYSVKAPIKTASRIDVPKSFARVRAGTEVPVAGVAWSQDRGIKAVQVRVDGGTWQEARLADADSVDTWRQWVWMWKPERGGHQLEVRAVDETGYVQTSQRAAIAPNGATGWHSVNVTAT
jgi:DMSO/TMAO reductase YedYZ molybdopterin-dependent catalytic subunit